MKAVAITVSDSRSAGEASDESGELLAEWARSIGADEVERDLVSDDRELIVQCLRRWLHEVDLVLTTGGTGFAPRDVTPEATRAVIDREAPGMAEAMRVASRDHTDLWMVSRGVCGVAGRTLIVNFPGAPKAIAEAGEGIRKAVPHALKLLSA